MVEYSTDVEFLQPTDPHRGNGVKLFEANNRGNKLAIAAFGVGVPLSVARRNALDSAGDGWLMRQGFTLVWWGWEMDAEPGWDRILMPEIVAHNADGSAITGVVRSEIITSRPTTTLPISLASKSNRIRSIVTTATRPSISTTTHRRPTASCQA